jgi:hypothetical protein
MKTENARVKRCYSTGLAVQPRASAGPRASRADVNGTRRTHPFHSTPPDLASGRNVHAAAARRR